MKILLQKIGIIMRLSFNTQTKKVIQLRIALDIDQFWFWIQN